MAFREGVSWVGAGATGTASGDKAARSDRYIIGPIIDFMFLGGGSLIFLPIIFVLPLDTYKSTITQGILLLAFLLNYPHFANSYQIFYRGFFRKAFSHQYEATLRARYVIAGIIVPAVLALFFVGSFLTGNPLIVGFAANIMFLLVGWHYVKQGYGILMVDAVKKRQLFQEAEKRIFRINGYAVWFLAWLVANRAVSRHEILTLHYYTFDTPSIIVALAGGVAAVTGILTVKSLLRCWRSNGGSLPYNGVFAYVASLYFWFFFMGWGIDPIAVLFVPALHSLQYLLIVWRYQIGYEKDRPGANENLLSFASKKFTSKTYQVNLAIFIILGMVLGAAGFWVIPILLQVLVSYDTETFGTRMFMFIFAIYINIHHYFLDNVIWRRDNPDMRRYLFN
jgi:hypothetical protein